METYQEDAVVPFKDPSSLSSIETKKAVAPSYHHLEKKEETGASSPEIMPITRANIKAAADRFLGKPYKFPEPTKKVKPTEDSYSVYDFKPIFPEDFISLKRAYLKEIDAYVLQVEEVSDDEVS